LPLPSPACNALFHCIEQKLPCGKSNILSCLVSHTHILLLLLLLRDHQKTAKQEEKGEKQRHFIPQLQKKSHNHNFNKQQYPLKKKRDEEKKSLSRNGDFFCLTHEKEGERYRQVAQCFSCLSFLRIQAADGASCDK
jgi:hypothetical protein